MDWDHTRIRALRTALRLSQAEFAELLGAGIKTVWNWEQGLNPPSLALLRALDEAWEAMSPEAERRFYASLPQDASTQELALYHGEPSPGGEDEDTKRRDFLRLAAVAPVVAPEVVSRVLADAATEAMAWTRHAEVSTLGRGTFDHLAAVLDYVEGAYGKVSSTDLFGMARTYRVQVDEMIQSRHTLKEGRELYVYASWLSSNLAWLAHDLGATTTAKVYAIDSYHYAEEAGHNELCGWAMDAAATFAEYDQRPAEAVASARRGMSKVSVRHPLAVRLRALAARASGRLGDRERCDDLLAEAFRLHDRLPSTSTTPFEPDPAALVAYAVTAYPASTYVWLGDFANAKVRAEEALSVRPSIPDRWFTQEAITHVDLGIALAGLGFPDGAAAQGRLALSSPGAGERVVSRAGDLDRALAARYPDLPEVRDFHEQYRQTVSRSV